MSHKDLEKKAAHKKRASDKVRRWRQKTKAKIVEAMGSRCQICFYSKSQWALELHHLNPSEKEFSFAKIRANPMALFKIAEELKKCILLCANCHRELHHGEVELPENFQRVDLEFLLNERAEKEKKSTEVKLFT